MPSCTGGAAVGTAGGGGVGGGKDVPSDMQHRLPRGRDSTFVVVADDLPNDLQRELDGVRAAHQTLATVVEGIDDEVARRPSLLPSWTVGHVLTHLARNADGMRSMLDAATRGEVASQYPGGAAQRSGDIEAGAARPAAELAADVVTSAAALEAAAAALTREQWATGHGASFGGTTPIAEVPFRRRREVVVHLADLGLADHDPWLDWPADFVRAELGRMTMQWASRRPMGLAKLPPEAMAVPDQQRLAWLFGRTSIPGLEAADAM